MVDAGKCPSRQKPVCAPLLAGKRRYGSEADMAAPISVFRRTALIGLKVIEGPAHHGSVGTLQADVDDDWECKGKRRAPADL